MVTLLLNPLRRWWQTAFVQEGPATVRRWSFVVRQFALRAGHGTGLGCHRCH